MNKTIIYKYKDGSCGVAILPAGTEEGMLDEIAAHAISNLPQEKEFVSYRIVDINDLPSDRAYRNAWTDDLDTKTVDVDIKKAQEIHRNKFRQLREPYLKKLDVEYQRALESKDKEKQAEIIAKKEELRDITTIELPDNLDQLKDFIPQILTH